MDKSESVKLRLDNDLLEQLREQARENERTLAKEITYQLKNREKEKQKMEQLETYIDYCREYIIDRLDDHNGNTYPDAWELSNAITQGDNMSGSFTYSTYKAKEYIKAWYFQAGAFLEDYADNYGEQLPHNPFTNPELFHGAMVIYGIEKLLNNIDTSNGEKITLNDKTIKDITKRLQAVNPYDVYIFAEN
jgi:hypothetical protein